ncbi:MAG: hypothetical protein JRI25_12795 [Deltaproteobacteria bacterium]|nr:hypothetical protein [Deltaproteobacteria bacterium]
MTDACSCCGYRTLPEAGAYHTCPVCLWQDEPIRDVTARSSLNDGMTLLEAQRCFAEHGVIEPSLAEIARKPLPSEARDANWQSEQARADLAAQPVLEDIERAYAGAPCPTTFTNVDHCEECSEHNEWFLSHAPGDLDLEVLESISSGWNPFCFLQAPGWAWYLPAVTRLALQPGAGWWLAELVGLHLAPLAEEADQVPWNLRGHTVEQLCALSALVDLAVAQAEVREIDKRQMDAVQRLWAQASWYR